VSTARLEAFSDGVFAVAITLLALDLRVDGPGHGTLAYQLGQRWPVFAAYVVSFFVIGIVWVNHHALFTSFARVDRTLMFLNLGLLLWIAAIPFGTSTMATYLRSGGGDAHLAAALYSGVLEGMSLSFASIFVWSLRSQNRTVPLPPSAKRAAIMRFTIGALFYVIAIGIAFVSAPASLVLNALIALYYVFEQTPTEPTQA
jgi:uncharacterized membrane protein